MGFYLLGLDRVTGELRTISAELYTTRAEALDALTAISSLRSFEYRDSEVFVADLDVATPVLLVASHLPEPVPAEEMAPEAVVEPDEPIALETVVVEEESALPVEAPIAEAVLAELADEELGVEVEEVAVEDTVCAESEDQEETSEPVDEFTAIADEIAEELEERGPGSDLAEALKRAAVTMEASGVVAPDSIEAVSAPVSDSDEDTVVAEDPGDSPAPASPAAWPWSVESGGESSDSPAQEELASESDAAVPAPPASVTPVFVPDSLEEPDIDSTDLVTARGDDESVALSKPVVLGAYDDDTSSAFDEIPTANTAETSLDTEAGVGSVLDDLEIIEEGSTPAGYTAAPATDVIGGAQGLTCDDCVYVNTCPNKEDLTPASCGTFQWKSD